MSIQENGRGMPNLPHWSQTSMELMSTCQRAWALTYPFHHDPYKTKTTTKKKNQPFFIIRLCRQIFMECLEDAYQNKVWTDEFLKARIQRGWRTYQRTRYEGIREKIIQDSIYRKIRSLIMTRPLRPIFQQKCARWAYFYRHEAVDFHGGALYAAPEIMIQIGGKWKLIRISFSRRTSPIQTSDLMDGLMVHWAMKQPQLPNHFKSFEIIHLAWSRRGWMTHHVVNNHRTFKDSFLLYHYDMQEVKWLQRRILANPDLSQLQLSESERVCRQCEFKNTCPAMKP